MHAKDAKHLKKIAILTIPISVIVLIIKYLAYYFTESVAFYSDALESIVNVVGAFILWWTIYVSHKPADVDHPYGHHKVEYFSAGLESMLIIVAACAIMHQAYDSFITSKALQEVNVGLLLNVAASIINGLWAFYVFREAKKKRSAALKATSVHILGDVLTSMGILIGVFIGYMTNISYIDPVIAFIVALHILWQGWKILYQSIQGLMDASLDFKETMQIREIISTKAYEALEVHDLRTRIAGRAVFIEFHLVVPSNMYVKDAHEICDRIEDALKENLGEVHVLIHIEPEEEAKLPLGTKAIPFA